MVDVTYISGNERLMDQIAPLWEELNRLHLRLSTYFRDYYEASTFEDRKRALQQRTCGGELRVDLALDVSKQPIGYCVTSIDQWLTGEIESLLMEKALDWLNVKGAKRKIVAVAVGNEQVYGFYEHFSFLPRRTLLEQKKQVESK